MNQPADGGGANAPGRAVLKISDLRIVNPALFLAADHLTGVNDFTGDEWTVEGHFPKHRGLVQLFLAPRVGHQHISSLESHVVDLTAHLLHMAPLEQADVARHN